MFLKNKNIIFKIRRSKVTDYAALSFAGCFEACLFEPKDSFSCEILHTIFNLTFLPPITFFVVYSFRGQAGPEF